MRHHSSELEPYSNTDSHANAIQISLGSVQKMHLKNKSSDRIRVLRSSTHGYF